MTLFLAATSPAGAKGVGERRDGSQLCRSWDEGCARVLQCVPPPTPDLTRDQDHDLLSPAAGSLCLHS